LLLEPRDGAHASSRVSPSPIESANSSKEKWDVFAWTHSREKMVERERGMERKGSVDAGISVS